MDWFSAFCILVIVVVLASVVVYMVCDRTPSPSKLRLPRIDRAAE